MHPCHKLLWLTVSHLTILLKICNLTHWKNALFFTQFHEKFLREFEKLTEMSWSFTAFMSGCWTNITTDRMLCDCDMQWNYGVTAWILGFIIEYEGSMYSGIYLQVQKSLQMKKKNVANFTGFQARALCSHKMANFVENVTTVKWSRWSCIIILSGSLLDSSVDSEFYHMPCDVTITVGYCISW